MKGMVEVEAKGYVRPDILVSTEWLADHLEDDAIRIVESNEDPLLYSSGHIPGASEIDWTRDLNDPVRRDYIQKAAFEKLLSHLGATRDTTIVFYGDKNNWWAAYALWVFQLFGHSNVKLLDGGRLKWQKEGRTLTKDRPAFTPTNYVSLERNDVDERAFRNQVLSHIEAGKKLIDVRSPKEFSGELLHMENYPNEGALRGGHIPGARSVPWSSAINPEDGTFKTAEELKGIYEAGAGLNSSDDVIVYCRIGERSAHTWFVLKYLLGYDQVRNYDGSWTEWGNSVGVPVEKGS